MNQRRLRVLALASAVAMVVGLFATTANAGWGHLRGYYPAVGVWGYGAAWSGCCDPCYTAYRPSFVACSPCVTPCYDPCQPTCVGPLRRLWYGLASHHYNFYGWRGMCGWGCGDPCCSTPCCSTCGADPCGCGSAWSDVEGTVIEGPTIESPAPATAQPTPAAPAPAAPAPAAPTPPAADVPPALPANPPAAKPAIPTQPSVERQTSLGPQDALLALRVPQDALVYVNGVPTRSTGTMRRYVSRHLTPGFQYTYELRVVVNRDGRPLTEQRVVRLQAGQTTQLALAPVANPVETILTLHVPTDAKVYLAGTPMRGTGPVRTFRTQRLAAGDNWSDYAIRVVVDQNGQKLAKQKTISLTGGQQRDLAFEFDLDRLAAAE